MPKLIEFEPTGIKCDMPGCGWRDDTAVFNKRTFGREWLNKPCPMCAGNLYTERDFKMLRTMMRRTWWINALLGWVVWLKPKQDRGMTSGGSLQSDGRGFITEADVKPGSVMDRAIKRAQLQAYKRANREKGELVISYSLEPGTRKRLNFIRLAISMFELPVWFRAELVWTAMFPKDGKAVGTIRWPKWKIDAFMTAARNYGKTEEVHTDA
jgi:hypothetical protein